MPTIAAETYRLGTNKTATASFITLIVSLGLVVAAVSSAHTQTTAGESGSLGQWTDHDCPLIDRSLLERHVPNRDEASNGSSPHTSKLEAPDDHEMVKMDGFRDAILPLIVFFRTHGVRLLLLAYAAIAMVVVLRECARQDRS